MENVRILVIGEGVNGSAIASKLQNGGVNVQVLARGERFEQIRDEGIIIENPLNHKRSVTRVSVIDNLSPDDIYDFVLVVVHKNQVVDLLPVLAKNKSPNIVFLGNNLTGPEEFTKVLDRKRIMLGTVVAGEKRDNDIIRAFVDTPMASPFGEMDGTITPRLIELVRTLCAGGIKAKISTSMVDGQMTHAAGVAIIGKLTMKYHCDLAALAASTEDLNLMVDARWEAHLVLRALGHKITPPSEDNIRFIPRFIQVSFMRLLLRSKIGEVGLAYHVSQAPDEMLQLAKELGMLADQSGLAVPAIRQFLDLC